MDPSNYQQFAVSYANFACSCFVKLTNSSTLVAFQRLTVLDLTVLIYFTDNKSMHVQSIISFSFIFFFFFFFFVRGTST